MSKKYSKYLYQNFCIQITFEYCFYVFHVYIHNVLEQLYFIIFVGFKISFKLIIILRWLFKNELVSSLYHYIWVFKSLYILNCWLLILLFWLFKRLFNSVVLFIYILIFILDFLCFILYLIFHLLNVFLWYHFFWRPFLIFLLLLLFYFIFFYPSMWLITTCFNFLWFIKLSYWILCFIKLYWFFTTVFIVFH